MRGKLYELGKKSREGMVRAVKALMRGDIAEAAPYLANPDNCDRLKQNLSGIFAWKSLAWAYEPEGPPPSEQLEALLEILCRKGIPVDEEVIKEIAEEADIEEGL